MKVAELRDSKAVEPGAEPRQSKVDPLGGKRLRFLDSGISGEARRERGAESGRIAKQVPSTQRKHEKSPGQQSIVCLLVQQIRST